jgi:hypothetical protein
MFITMRSLLHLFKQSRYGLVVGASATYGLNQVSSTDTKKAQHQEQPRKQQLHQQDKGHLLLQSTFKNYATFNQDPISPPRMLAISHGNATFNQDPISPPRVLATSHDNTVFWMFGMFWTDCHCNLVSSCGRRTAEKKWRSC